MHQNRASFRIRSQFRTFMNPVLISISPTPIPDSVMAVIPPAHCFSPLDRSLVPRSTLTCYRHFWSRPNFSVKAPSNVASPRFRCAMMSDSAIGSSAASSSSAIDFLTLCHRLKTTKRKGWINHGIKGPESIADHMYRMALMGLIAGDLPGLNRERCIKLAIVHDIAEAIVGDITPSDNVPKHEKSRLEQEALNEMCDVLGGGMRAKEIKELWEEYENNASLEANLVKDFDKVEMILQALEYEMEHGKVLDEFFLSTAGKFQTEIGKSWAAEIISRRNSRLASKLQ